MFNIFTTYSEVVLKRIRKSVPTNKICTYCPMKKQDHHLRIHKSLNRCTNSSKEIIIHCLSINELV